VQNSKNDAVFLAELRENSKNDAVFLAELHNNSKNKKNLPLSIAKNP